MSAPVSVRLDDDVRKTLEAEARARHIGLSTYLRQIAIETAARLPRVRMRALKAAPSVSMSRARPRRPCSTMNGVRPGSRTHSSLAGFSGGQVVIADWRDALPKEPNKLRRCDDLG